MEGLDRIEELRNDAAKDTRILDAVRDWTIDLGLRSGVDATANVELSGE